MAAPPPAYHSTVVPFFYGSLSFLHKHSWLWMTSLSTPQAVSSQSTAVLPRVCSPIPTFQLSAPVCTSGHTSQSGVCRAVAWTVCIDLTLFCLPQVSRFTLL